jgi:hypothetical protein
MMEFFSWLENTEFCSWLRGSGSIWAYPLVLTMHTMGMGILVGFNWALDLRILGVGKQIPVRAMDKFFPVMWVGFWLNLVTGILLLAADATTKMTSWVFGVKMFFIILAMIVLRKIQSQVLALPAIAPREAQPPMSSPAQGGGVAVLESPVVVAASSELANAKLLAILSLVFWTFSITAGRLMAYLGPQTGIK